MQLTDVLDLMKSLFEASEHPDIAKVERYGTATEPWGPKSANHHGSIAGVKVTHESTATASLWGAVRPGEVPIPIPEELPLPKDRRAARIAILAVRLLDAARPPRLASWQLIAMPDLGPSGERGSSPVGVSIVDADGKKHLLLTAATGATVGNEPEADPSPDYRIPEGITA